MKSLKAFSVDVDTSLNVGKRSCECSVDRPHAVDSESIGDAAEALRLLVGGDPG